MSSPIGRTLGAYRVVEALGRGGMATVFRAIDEARGETVALKTVDATSERLVQSIRREIRALARVRHPGIVRIVADGLDEGVPWYAMELIEGETLGRLCERGGVTEALDATREAPWWTRTLAGDAGDEVGSEAGGEPVPLPRLLTIARALCASLAYLHGEGLVHRDLKPDNILLRAGGAPVLVDFGLASTLGARSSRESLDVRWELAGTAAYMAPEIIRGEAVDARADLYALGCILYEMVTGTKPFAAFTVQAVLRGHLDQAPRPPSELAPEMPARLEALILRLLAKQPRDRLGHADDVARELEALGAAPPAEPLPAARDYLYRPGLVGRAACLERLERAIGSARRGEGRLVLVGGESGIGKTRLVNELGVRAAQRGALVLEGECTRGGPPLEAWLDPLERLADRCHSRGPAEAQRVFGARAAALTPYVPALDALPIVAPRPTTELGPDASRARVFEAVTGSLRALVAEQPLLLVLDDLQWADRLTLDLLRHLARELLPHAGVAIVGTYRSDEVGPWLRRLVDVAGVEALGVERLEEPAVRALIGDMLADPSPGALASYLATQSEGNPFFVAEYLRAALEAGLLRRDAGGRWGLDRPPGPDGTLQLPLPGSLRELVRRRLADLSPTGAALVEAAAVLGEELTLDRAGSLAELEEGEAFRAADELMRRQVLSEGAGRLRFAHHKLLEGARDALSSARRRELHRRAAELLRADPGVRPATLARHWLAAGETARALDALDAAAPAALARAAYRQAADAWGVALERAPDDDPRRTRWEQGLAEALLGLGETSRGQTHLLHALALRGYPASGPGPLALASGLLGALGRQLARRLGAPARPADRATILQATRGHQRLVETHWFENDAPRMLDAGLRALNLAETAGPSPELVRAYATASLAIGSLPIHPLAERYARLAMETAESVGDPAAEAYARFLLCVYRIGTGDWARVDADLERALAIWEALGDPRFAGDGQTVQAMSRLYRGEHARAEALFEEVEALGRRFENVQHRAWGLLGSAEAALRSGRPDAAGKALDTAAALLGDSPGQLLERFRLEGLRAQVHLARGALGAAEEAADRAEARGDELAVPTAHYLLEGYAGVVEARLAAWRAGGAPEARRAARRALRRLRLFAAIFRIGAPRAWASYAEAWELEGKRARARAARRRARARAEALGMRWEAERAGSSGAAKRAGDARAPGPVGRTP